jgi:hypothetical protein
MKKINLKIKYMHILIIFGILLLINFISAYGISKEYFDGNPAKIGPGETKEISFGLIVLSPNETARTLSIEMINGSDIARLVNDRLTVPAGSRDTEIKLRVSIPQNVPEGTLYQVVLNVKDISITNDTGMINFVTSSTSSIPILVEKSVAPPATPPVEKPAGNYSWVIIVIALAIIIAIVAYLLLRRKEAHSKSK